jgi:uncharacterized protein YukE
MNEITVFDVERECGLAEAIQTQASVAFVAALEPATAELYKQLNLDESIIQAGLSDPDVYHLYSILVTSSWNKNDDIFDKQEVWEARHTPRFKPTNLEHDEKQLVGGIINSWPVDVDINVIPEDTADLPDLYHILVSSVVYRQWKDPELKARAEELIQQIEAGTKYVSMECKFFGFDYGVVDTNGAHHQVPRNESTAFLTQHLRSYGGEGTYQGHKLGRLLRNITFTGKGFVNRPANPESIIFEKDHIFSFADVKDGKSLFLNKNGVNNNEEHPVTSNDALVYEFANTNEENNMSDILNTQIKELKEALAAVQAENKALTTKLSEASVTAYEAQIQELTENVSKLNDTVTELEGQLEESKKKVTTVETALSEKTEALDTAVAALDKKEKEDKSKERKEKMGKAGLSVEEIEARFEIIATLSDDQFDAFIETLAVIKPAEAAEETNESEATEEETEETEETETEEVEASEVVSEETEEGEVALSSEEDEAELSTARASLEQWVRECIMNEETTKE